MSPNIYNPNFDLPFGYPIAFTIIIFVMTTPAVKKPLNHDRKVLHPELWRLNWLPPAQ